jgi:hypothetical protein
MLLYFSGAHLSITQAVERPSVNRGKTSDNDHKKNDFR